MRIAFICVSLRGGGTERIVTRFANHLANQNQVSIVTLVPGEAFYKLDPKIELIQPPANLTQYKILRVIQQVRHVYHTITKNRHEVYCIFGEDISGFCCILAKITGVKRIFAFNRGNPDRSLIGWNGRLNPLALAFADKVIVQTQQAADLLQSRYRKCKLAVIPNPVEILGDTTPMAERSKRITYVASIGRNKNQIALIKAFAGCEKIQDWELVLVGDGPDRSKLESLAVELGVDRQTKFLGVRKDIPALLQDSQIFAFPSLSEGFPNALAEAMAAGCAVISYDCPCGPAEMIENGISGILVPLNDQTMFKTKLQYLINDVSVRKTFGEAAGKAAHQFSDDFVFKLLDDLVSKS